MQNTTKYTIEFDIRACRARIAQNNTAEQHFDQRACFGVLFLRNQNLRVLPKQIKIPILFCNTKIEKRRRGTTTNGMQTKLNEIQFSVAIFNQRKQNGRQPVKRNIVTPSRRLLIRTVCTATRPHSHSDNMLLQQLCSNAKLSGMFDVEIPQLK